MQKWYLARNTLTLLLGSISQYNDITTKLKKMGKSKRFNISGAIVHPIHIACLFHNNNLVRYLVEKCGVSCLTEIRLEPWVKEAFVKPTEYGIRILLARMLPIHCCAISDNLEQLKYQMGVHLQLRDVPCLDGTNCLQLSCIGDKIEIFNALLDAGANFKLANEEGLDPLFTALALCAVKCFKVIFPKILAEATSLNTKAQNIIRLVYCENLANAAPTSVDKKQAEMLEFILEQELKYSGKNRLLDASLSTIVLSKAAGSTPEKNGLLKLLLETKKFHCLKVILLQKQLNFCQLDSAAHILLSIKPVTPIMKEVFDLMGEQMNNIKQKSAENVEREKQLRLTDYGKDIEKEENGLKVIGDNSLGNKKKKKKKKKKKVSEKETISLASPSSSILGSISETKSSNEDVANQNSSQLDSRQAENDDKDVDKNSEDNIKINFLHKKVSSLTGVRTKNKVSAITRIQAKYPEIEDLALTVDQLVGLDLRDSSPSQLDYLIKFHTKMIQQIYEMKIKQAQYTGYLQGEQVERRKQQIINQPI